MMKYAKTIIIITFFLVGAYLISANSYRVHSESDPYIIIVNPQCNPQQLEKEVRQVIGLPLQVYGHNKTGCMIVIPAPTTREQRTIVELTIKLHSATYPDLLDEQRNAWLAGNITYYMENYESLSILQQRTAIRMLMNYTLRNFKTPKATTLNTMTGVAS